MKFVAKLSDGQYLEIGVREIDEAEAEDADEVVSLAPDEEKQSGGLRRLAALGVVAVGAIAISRRLRGGSRAETGDEEAEQEEPIEVEP